MTTLLYLQDTYCFAGAGTVIATGSDERGAYVILDQTIVYPQGGGQPSDVGELRFGESALSVSAAGYVDGDVRHYVGRPDRLPEIGERVSIKIDEQRRLANSRVHSAGHLVAHVAEVLYPQLVATKGYHFADGPYVECAGTSLPSDDMATARINERIAEIIASGATITARVMTFAELAEVCAHLPSNLPKDKPLRAVQIGSLAPVPCGGTHVRSVAELGRVTVTKIREKKGHVKISYECAPT